MGMDGAGNASANLVASQRGRVRVVLALAFFTHLAGALLSGTAVASTVLGAIDVPRSDLATVLAAGTLAALGLLVLATGRGLPVSAGLALVAGLAGAAWAANGIDGIVWGGLHGVRPYGVLGAALAMVVAPLLGLAAAATTRALAGVVLHRASVRAMRPIGGLLWVSSGFVGFADGSNDGQKAMAIVVGALVARGSLTGGGIPMWVRFAVGFTLALGTLLGARVLRTVSRRLYATRGLDAAMAESSSAVVIIASSLVGAPVEHDGGGDVGRRRRRRGAAPSSHPLVSASGGSRSCGPSRSLRASPPARSPTPCSTRWPIDPRARLTRWGQCGCRGSCRAIPTSSSCSATR